MNSALNRVRGRELVVPQVYAELRQAILRGRIAPGTRLIEAQLALTLGVSRTPVREAVRKLEAEGLVVRQSSGGVVVGDTETELLEIYRIRERLEGLAARLAAERASDGELAEIADACRAGEQVLDSRSAAERASFNRVFHGLIAKASHSPRLVRLIDEYYEYLLHEDMSSFHDPAVTREHHRQHEEVVAALRHRDGDKAEASIRRHLDSVLSVVRGVLGRTAPAERA